MKNKIYYIVIVILLIIIGYMYSENKKSESTYIQNLKASESSIKVYKDALDREVYEKGVIQLTAKELKHLNDSLKTSIKNMKPDVITNTKIKVVYRDTNIIRYDKSIDFKFSKSFIKSDKHIYIAGLSTEEGVRFNKIQFSATLTNTIGYTRKNMFSKYEPISRITVDGEYIKVVDIKTYKVKPKESILSNKWVWLGVGLIGGSLIVN